MSISNLNVIDDNNKVIDLTKPSHPYNKENNADKENKSSVYQNYFSNLPNNNNKFIKKNTIPYP